VSLAHLTPLQQQRLEAVDDALAAVRAELVDHIETGSPIALIDARDRLADLAGVIDEFDRRPFAPRLSSS
jgi:hypothetical protein